jgi:hypothetical protein
MTAPKTFEMEMTACQLGNWAWERLQHLMDDGLSTRDRIDVGDVDEAETLLKFKRAIAEKSDFLMIRLRYEPD